MARHWRQENEAGSPWLTRLFARTCLFVGPTVGRWLLRPITAYFLLVRRREREASRQFLRRALGREPGWRDLWQHFFTFSHVTLDRVFILGAEGRGVRIDPVNKEVLYAAMESHQGCLLLGSHLGSFEASRAVKRRRPEVPLRIVMDTTQSPAASAFLEALNPELRGEVLDVGARPGAGVAILQALEGDALVGLLADRAHEKERTISAEFFGETAEFPAGPHEIAMVTQVPSVLMWGLHVGPGRYVLRFDEFPPPPKATRVERRQAIEASVQRYATRLEELARQYPYNWFNFYDFWNPSE